VFRFTLYHLRPIGTYKPNFRTRLALVALLGGVSGFAAAAQKAGARECYPGPWGLSSASINSDDANVDHTAYWTEEGTIEEASPGYVWLRFDSAPPGAVFSLVGAD
jgi:hypothetical protein